MESAAKSGVKYYRSNWYKYDKQQPMTDVLEMYQNQIKDLGNVNKKLGLVGCYQNHAGNHVGAPIWDLPTILSATKNEYMGCQYDIRHAVVEGGSSWEA